MGWNRPTDFKHRLQQIRDDKAAKATRERRGGDPPGVPAALAGGKTLTPEEIQRATSYLPTKPPTRTP